ILVLSNYDESLYAERALRAGAKGYVMKHLAIEHIMTAIRQVLGDRVYLSDRMRNLLLGRLVGSQPALPAPAIERLSDRELEGFQLIGEGQAPREISNSLHLSISTVETYRAHIKQKLGLQNAAQLVQHAVQWANAQHP